MSSLSSTEAFVPRERWRFLRAELRWAYSGRTYQKHGNHWAYAPHTSAWLVLQGRATVRTARGLCNAGVGQWLIAPSGDRWQQTSLDCKILSICFNWQWAWGQDLFPLPGAIKLKSSDHPGLKSLGSRLAKKAERLFPKGRTTLPELSGAIDAHLELQAGFDAWLVHYSRAMLEHGLRPSLMTLDPRVEQALQILDHPNGRALRPTELSKQVGVSSSQMNRLFLHQLGTTVRGYHEQQKLASARMLLGGGTLSVKEIAFRLGFASPQHFSRWFRKKSGVSPTQLRHGGTPMI